MIFIYLILLAACRESKYLTVKVVVSYFLVETFLTFDFLLRENYLKVKMWVPLPRVTYTWKLMGQWALGWDFSPMLHFLLEYLWV
jgi:hypothetical protein